MNCFISTNIDIFYNLALEEFLLKQTSEDFFFLWRSKPVVVVGKHQNPYKEIDYFKAIKKQITVARRLSGGGTIYQDLGNINFTIIKKTKEGKQINLKKHSKMVFEALSCLGIDVNYSDRNDFLLNGKKISGNAEHVYKNRVLHHGTLLFDTDLDILRTVLKNKSKKYQDQTVSSVSSAVVNIKPSFDLYQDTRSFMNLLFEQILSLNHECRRISISPNIKIQDLRNNKYSTLEWIFLYTPKYELNNKFIYQNLSCSVKLRVKKGIIQSAQINGLESIKSINIKILEQQLQNKPHLVDEFESILKTWQLDTNVLTKEFF